MALQTVTVMEGGFSTEIGEFESDLELEGSISETQFVGAVGLSPVRELAWANGLIDIDDPAPWEPV